MPEYFDSQGENEAVRDDIFGDGLDHLRNRELAAFEQRDDLRDHHQAELAVAELAG